MSVCLSMIQKIYYSFYLILVLSICLSVSLSVCLTVCLSVCLWYKRFTRCLEFQFNIGFVYLSVCLTVCLYVCLWYNALLDFFEFQLNIGFVCLEMVWSAVVCGLRFNLKKRFLFKMEDTNLHLINYSRSLLMWSLWDW